MFQPPDGTININITTRTIGCSRGAFEPLREKHRGYMGSPVKHLVSCFRARLCHRCHRRHGPPPPSSSISMSATSAPEGLAFPSDDTEPGLRTAQPSCTNGGTGAIMKFGSRHCAKENKGEKGEGEDAEGETDEGEDAEGETD